jgi:hypothetical protein
MREKLAPLLGQRITCEAIYVERGTRTSGGYVVHQLLFRDVRAVPTGEELTDHLWFAVGKWCEHLVPGEKVRFDARVQTYIKGYHDDRRMDYRLARPTNVRRLREFTEENGQLGLGL